jgi:PAS domain S-box-containing protein
MRPENPSPAEIPGDVLVVDDKLENLRTIEALLKEKGYKVRCVPDTKTALEVAANKPPEIMLLDVLMPDMNGYEVCRALKARPETERFPIIFLTALTEMENLVEGFQAGGVAFLSKPVRPEELLAHVRTHVELHRARKAIQNHKELLEQRLAERTADLQEANRKLRENQRFQESLLNSSPDIIHIYDIIEGRNIYSNEGLVNTLGYSVEEVQDLGENLLPSLMHPEDLDIYRTNTLPRYQKAEDGELIEHEFRMKHKDGMWRWLHSRESIFKRLSDGKPKQIFGVASDITEQKKVENSLLESEEKYRHLIENIPSVAWVTSEHGETEFISPTVEKIYGFSQEEIYEKGGALWFGRIHPDDIDKVRESFEGVFTGGLECDVEYRIQRKDGEWIWIHDKAVVAFEKDKVRYANGVFTDITERKRAEEARRQSEKNYREIFNATSEAIVLHDSETGEFLDFNQTMLEMFGYTHQEALQLEVKDISSGEPSFSKEEALRKIRKAVDEGPQVFDWRCKRKNNDYFWASVSLKNTQIGGQGRVLAVIRDISERKESEKALQENEFRLNAIFNHQYQLTALLDPDGVVLMINQTACNMVGKGSADFVGKYFWDLPHWSHSESLRGRVRAGVQQVQQGKDISFETIHPDSKGELHYIDFSMTPIKDEAGNVIFLVPEGHDITESKNAENKRNTLERQLQQAQKMEAIGTLAGGIAHDFNNILSVIMGNAEITLYDLPEDNPLRYSISQVVQAGHRAKDLVQQILTFSRQDSPVMRPVRVSLIVKEVMKLMRSSLPSTIEIRQNIVAEKDAVMADPTQIHQILMNLCTNAQHAMREKGGILEVRLADMYLDSESAADYPELEPGQFLKLTVKDTGHGMTPDLMGRVFDPYFTSKAKDVGTGLGLSVVDGILKRCKGSISVQSEPNQGTQFDVFFPCVDMGVEFSIQEIEPIPRGSERILFVDDEMAICDIEKRMLQNLGYKVDIKSSAIEALEAFRLNPERYDLVITDYTMPNMTGDQLTRVLLSIRPDIPVILCTGFSEMITEETAKEAGIKGFVMKPIVLREIGNLIRKVLEKGIED